MNILTALKRTTKVFQSENDLIDQIHGDFYNASDLLVNESELLLQRANEILQQKDESDMETLVDMGFRNSKSVADYSKAKDEKARAKHTIDNVAKYAKEFPFNKFITKDAVDSVCKKYGLLRAIPRDFLGEIPVKNQQEMVAFKQALATKKAKENEGVAPELIALRDSIASFRFGLGLWGSVDTEFQIVAPPNQLDMRGKEVRGTTLVTKDPIVLYQVDDGFIIVSAWGKEANDVEVQNDKLN